jgi:uncharacterized protein
MAYGLVALAAFLGALMSFFSGFGLGTVLLPAMMIFFAPSVAIAATAVVHMLNNGFKLLLVGKHAHMPTVWSFGGWSVLGAAAGAWILTHLNDIGPLHTYSWWGGMAEITWIKCVLAFVILFFVWLEISKVLEKHTITQRWFGLGGLVSGFFGGLSGHQGAVRSAFLMNAGFSKETFIGTRAAIAALVDATRITVYIGSIGAGWSEMDHSLLLVATAAAFSGAFLGNRWLKKTTSAFVDRFVSGSLVVFALLLATGIV